jgi:glutathione-regulated potassium-efflux system ancillary protein KefF
MAAALLVFAHPYPERSIANRVLLTATEGLDGLETRSLYDLYPGFDIDVEAERRALVDASVLIWQHPMYWYSVPGLLKHWFDKVLTRGFAYGQGGTALVGKRCLWVTTTGGDEGAFTPAGYHAHPFGAFTPPVEQTARFCGMRWEEPFVVHGAHRAGEAGLRAAAQRYRARLEALIAESAVAS